MICPTCRQDAGAGPAFCPHCGTKLAPPVCPVCNHPAPSGGAFCTNCGSPVGSAAPPPAPASPPSPRYTPPPPADARILQSPGAGPAPHVPAKPQGEAAPPRKSGCLGAGIGCLVVIALLVGGFFALDGPDLIEEWIGGAADGGDAPARGVKLDPDTPPVRFTRPEVSPLASAPLGQSLFVFKVENVSKCDLSAVSLTAVLFDENGRRLPGEQEVGVAADVGDIHPGDTYECKFTSGTKEAVRAAVVLKEVIYVFRPGGKGMEMLSAPMKWKNPRFEAELEAAAAR